MFEWDDANIGHLARHGIDPEEAEEAMCDAKRVRTEAYNTPFEKRYAIIGKTSGGRILFVMFTKRGIRFRVGTARAAKPSEKRLYRRRQ